MPMRRAEDGIGTGKAVRAHVYRTGLTKERRKCACNRCGPAPRALQPCNMMSGDTASSRERTVGAQKTSCPGCRRVLSGLVDDPDGPDSWCERQQKRVIASTVEHFTSIRTLRQNFLVSFLSDCHIKRYRISCLCLQGFCPIVLRQYWSRQHFHDPSPAPACGSGTSTSERGAPNVLRSAAFIKNSSDIRQYLAPGSS